MPFFPPFGQSQSSIGSSFMGRPAGMTAPFARSEDEEGRRLWQQLAAAYEDAEKTKKFSQLGQIGAFLGATIAGPGVRPMMEPFAALAGGSEDRVSSAQNALKSYMQMRGFEDDMQHRDDQLALEREKLENQQEQFDTEHQYRMDTDAQQLAEMEEQGMSEDAYREQMLALERYKAMKAGEGGGFSPKQVYDMQRDAMEDARREQEKQQRLAVPGMQPGPGSTPEGSDAVRKSLESTKKMKGYITGLKDMYSKHGEAMKGTQEQAMMEQLTKMIELEAKNVAQLGALSGPDMGMITGLTQLRAGGNPLHPFKGPDRQIAALDGLEKWADETLNSTASAQGYQPADDGSQPTQQNPNAPPYRTLRRVR